ncbi:MAG: DUF2202 domain-containing protein [Methylococcaceae bacterium]|nr:DUF2202 domain-containing protein [Methylococcaceae bacterium]
MKKLLNSTLLMTLTLSSISIQAVAKQGQGMGGPGQESFCELTSEQVLIRTLSEKELDTLNFMREEEKLARDVYKTLYGQWNTQVFTNIAASEQKHMDKVKVFLDAYQLPDPASSEVGQFNNTVLQNLYDDLLAKGSQSKLEAFKVGAMVEEVDIFDLENAIAETDNDELKVMYTQLMQASHNHLRAFSRQIINIEGEYIAQYMSSEAVASILDRPKPDMMHGNAILLNPAGHVSEDKTCFVASINSEQDLLQNGSTIKGEDTITVTHQITANANDLNKVVDWVIVASYQAENSDQTQFFTHNADNWQAWDGQANNLPATKSAQQLLEGYTLQIFQGQLQGMPGVFSIFSGYRLDDGSIVYNRFPTVFKVSE